MLVSKAWGCRRQKGQFPIEGTGRFLYSHTGCVLLVDWSMQGLTDKNADPQESTDFFAGYTTQETTDFMTEHGFFLKSEQGQAAYMPYGYQCYLVGLSEEQNVTIVLPWAVGSLRDKLSVNVNKFLRNSSKHQSAGLMQRYSGKVLEYWSATTQRC